MFTHRLFIANKNLYDQQRVLAEVCRLRRFSFCTFVGFRLTNPAGWDSVILHRDRLIMIYN